MVEHDNGVRIRAAHVPAAEGEDISNPVRSLAKLELGFSGLRGESGRPFDGILILHVRDDGMVLGKAHDHPVMLTAIYTDRTEDEPVTAANDLAVLNKAAEDTVRTLDLASVWADSRMFALYQQALEADVAAQRAIADFNDKHDRYRNHVARHYKPDENGNIDPKEQAVSYIILDENGDAVDDEQ